MITKQQIKNICPTSKDSDLDRYVPFLNQLMPKYDINTPQRQRHFIAQIAHESMCFSRCTEMYNGTPAEYFKRYEGRKDLGNTFQGDGLKFKGRGLIQITGRYNYNAFSIDVFGNESLLTSPEILEQPSYAVEVACWFWKRNHINSLADADQIKAITVKINGGLNGFLERQMFYNLAKKYIS